MLRCARAAIAEGLHAVEREADRVGVVPVRVEAVAGEMRLDPLQSGRRGAILIQSRAAPHDRSRRALARWFMRRAIRSVYHAAHLGGARREHGRPARFHPRRARAVRQPGPATVSLAATGAAFGARRGLAYMTGIDAGMVVVMAVTAAGVTGLVLAIPGATPVVAVLAALYFIHLAWRIATAPPLSQDAAQGSEPSFAAGVFLSLVNPKGYAAMAALFSGFVLIRGRPELDAALKLAVLVVIVVVGQRRLAVRRRGADALLPRAADEPDHQCDVRDPADRVGRRDIFSLSTRRRRRRSHSFARMAAA